MGNFCWEEKEKLYSYVQHLFCIWLSRDILFSFAFLRVCLGLNYAKNDAVLAESELWKLFRMDEWIMLMNEPLNDGYGKFFEAHLGRR
jgi:hypothetical protein